MTNTQKITMLALLVAIIIITGCTTETVIPTGNNELNSIAVSLPEVDKIEVYHFHATQQCYSCKTVGAYAEETVKTYFAEELQSGKISFASINVDEEMNRMTAEKYGATGSSLWIGVYDSAGFHPEQNTNVWYKIDNKEGYMTYLKGVIDKRMQGDFS